MSISIYEQVRAKSLPASADLSASQYCFVDLDGSGNLALPSSGASVAGVLQDKPNAAGQPGAVCSPGDITRVVCGGTITAGQKVMTNSSGNAVACTSGSYILGKALQGGSSGGEIPILFQPAGKL